MTGIRESPPAAPRELKILQPRLSGPESVGTLPYATFSWEIWPRYLGRSVRRSLPAIGLRLSYCLRSSSDTLRAPASFARISSEANRLPSSYFKNIKHLLAGTPSYHSRKLSRVAPASRCFKKNAHRHSGAFKHPGAARALGGDVRQRGTLTSPACNRA